jgi:hypothetical protein
MQNRCTSQADLRVKEADRLSVDAFGGEGEG